MTLGVIPEILEIKLLQKKKTVQIRFSNETEHTLSCEYLRVFSPSAEVQGHGGAEMKLILGKENINIIDIQPVGNYAVKLVFDDGHDSGIYTWETLYKLAEHAVENWCYYQKRVKEHVQAG